MLEMNHLYNMDCMEGMKDIPDKFFELAIVDPPYGIGGGSNTLMNVDWDSNIPTKEYFNELIRVSTNQIIWGGNYMSTNIPFASTHTIIWDKENGKSFMSDAEIAFTSFNKQTTKIYRLFWMSNMMKSSEKPLIHPTQKPKELYGYLLTNYAKQGDKILDTHVGSGSSIIACMDYHFDFMGFEIDKDYFEAAQERIDAYASQMRMEIL
jgi:site-specific DNA-methyltransferase (adenine-specific)